MGKSETTGFWFKFKMIQSAGDKLKFLLPVKLVLYQNHDCSITFQVTVTVFWHTHGEFEYWFSAAAAAAFKSRYYQANT